MEHAVAERLAAGAFGAGGLASQTPAGERLTVSSSINDRRS
jgi:hypothetical protein